MSGTQLAVPANLQWLGAAKETTYGTPVAAPTVWIPIDGSSTKWVPNINPLVDNALRGQMSAEYQQQQGMRYETLDYKTYLYLDSLYMHFLAILGRPDAISGGADPYTHKTALENGVDNTTAQPPSYTLFYFDGVLCHQIPGCIMSELKTTVAVDNLDTLEASWMGLPSTTITPPTNTPSTNRPFPAWNSVVTLGGTPLSVYSSIELDWKRDAAAVNTINGSQSPLAIFSGAFSVAGTITAVYQTSDVNMGDYLVNTQPPLTVKCSPVGDATHYLLLQHSAVAYDAAAPSGSNKWMEVQATIKALANATDALDGKLSPAQVQFLSPQSTAF